MTAQIRDQFIAVYQGVVESLIAWTPRVVLAVVFILAALIVARILERVVRGLLVRLKFDSLLERVGVDQALQKIGIRRTPSPRSWGICPT
jgi:hypothetical protein